MPFIDFSAQKYKKTKIYVWHNGIINPIFDILKLNFSFCHDENVYVSRCNPTSDRFFERQRGAFRRTHTQARIPTETPPMTLFSESGSEACDLVE